jgi:hypothetical protein
MQTTNEPPRPLLLLHSSPVKPLPRDWHFSERLDLNILSDGRPAVVHVGPSQTQTLTEVRNETTDQD